jgi:hypothetical protein
MGLEIEEVDDKEFDAILAENRHKELINSLKLMLVEMQKDSKQSIIRGSVEKLTDIINKFVNESISQQNRPQPEVKVDVETNQDKVIVAVKNMQNQILKELGILIDVVEGAPVIDSYEWTFDRGSNNLIYKSTAKVIYK